MLEGQQKVTMDQNERHDEKSNSESQETPKFYGPLPSSKSRVRFGGKSGGLGVLGILGAIEEEGLGLPILLSSLWLCGEHIETAVKGVAHPTAHKYER